MSDQKFNQQRGFDRGNQQGGQKQDRGVQGGSGHQYGQQQNFDWTKWKPKIKEWIQNKIDKDTITFGERFGKQVKDEGLTTSQIRNVFGELRRIQANGFFTEMTSFLMVKPKLAYAAKRQGAVGLDNFYSFFCEAYDSIQMDDPNAEKQFTNFMQLAEAVLAYHKFYGGK